MAFKELFDVLKSDETKEIGKEIVENAIGALQADPIACNNLKEIIVKSPFSLRDQFFWNRFYNFLRGVYLSPDDAIALSSKLFANDNDKKRNGMRIFEYIGKIDTDDTLQFMINATRSFLLGLIKISDYFRIAKALTDSLYEDLIYLSEHITEADEIQGNIQVLALSRAGLMIEAGIDGNEDVENQYYVFTTLGRLVDRYAISFENEERYKWYENKVSTPKLYDTGMEEISEEEVRNLFEKS